MRASTGSHGPAASRLGGPSFASRLLRQELVPSVGCTEPAALALVAAAAADAADGRIRKISIRSDGGTFKNSLSVGLPGTRLRGPAVAVAAGALVANPGPGLEIFGSVTETQWGEAAELAQSGRIEVIPEDWRDIRLEARVEGSESRGEALVESRHDRFVWIRRDGNPVGGDTGGRDPVEATGIDDETIRGLLDSAGRLLEALSGIDPEELALVRRGTEMNRELASRSLEEGFGGGLGRAFRSLGEGDRDPSIPVKSWVSAGVEARMSGEMAPVMTSGGSGNSGITVSLGIWAAARVLGDHPASEIDRATALGHLVNVAVKARIGRVGSLCGGAIASAMGVGCGVAWLLGGREAAVDRVIRHLVNTTAGTLCDGAKPACALKISSGLSVALDAARMAVRDDGRIGRAGLGGADGRAALERLHRLARETFHRVDHDLLPILTGS